MEQSIEELSKTFTVNAYEDKNLIELKFVTDDVGKKNVDLQSDLVSKAIMKIFKKLLEWGFEEEEIWKSLK